MNSNEQPTKKFHAEYYHDGAWWTVQIFAYDFADAEVRCKKLNLQLLGEHMLTVRTGGKANWLADLICRLRNHAAQWRGK